MKRIAIVSAAAMILLQAPLGARAMPQQAGPSRTPVLTNEDLTSPRTLSSTTYEAKPSATRPRGATLNNATSVLQNALSKMAEVKSVRTRIQTFLPTGEREVVIETVKPNRTHLRSPEGEMIAIGSKVYLKTGDAWVLTPVSAGMVPGSDSGFDFSTLINEMIGKSKVQITGQMLGDEEIDGLNCSVYEFEVTDRSETGTIQISVGKKDGYMRRLTISGPAPGQGGSSLTINVWFNDINQPISIRPPM